MPPRNARGRGRGRDGGRELGPGVTRGRGNVPEVEEEVQVPVAPEQGTPLGAVAEAQHNAGEAQSGAPGVDQPAAVDAGAISQQLAATLAVLAERAVREVTEKFLEGCEEIFAAKGSSKKRFKGSSSALSCRRTPQPSQGSSALRQARRPGASVSQPIICHRCRRPGHRRAECPQNPRQTESVGQSGGRPTGDVRACYGCGQPGHIMRFCPYAPGGALESGQVRQIVTGQTGRPSESQPAQQSGGGPARTGPSEISPSQRGGVQGQRDGRSSGTSAQGRVYAVAQQGDSSDPVVTRGTFSVFPF